MGNFLRRGAWYICLAFICVLLGSAAICDQVCVVLNAQSQNECIAAIESIESAGGQVRHVFPPQTLICDLSASIQADIAGLQGVRAVLTGSSETGAFTGFDATSLRGLQTWNLLCAQHWQMPAASNDSTGSTTSTLSPDTTYSEADHSPGYYETSSFMIGSVSVGVVLPESAGDSENWSDDRVASVICKIVQGLDWWISQSSEYARLKFFYDIPDCNIGAACSLEPINLSTAFGESWIRETMSSLGYYKPDVSGTAFTKAYINDVRTKFGTDWACCIFAVDSLKDADGCFPDGNYAYGSQADSTMVITYDCGGWGHDRFDLVVRHEMGHVFGAADEYCSASMCCGYLYVKNGNCVAYNSDSVPCIMKSYCDSLCVYTRGQIGWQDTDGDGIWDPVDTDVTCAAECLEGVSTSSRMLSFIGSACDIPAYTLFFTPVTINHIEAVEFKIDSGAWTAAEASDGKFDSPMESFTFDSAVSECRQHTIEVRARNTVGNLSPVCEVDVCVLPDTTVSIGSAKKSAEGSIVCVADKIVTAVVSGGDFYIEEDNRASGLRVNASASVKVGDRVTLTGTMCDSSAGEPFLKAISADVVCSGAKAPSPLGVNLPTALSNGLCWGLLIRVWGSLTKSDDGVWTLYSSSECSDDLPNVQVALPDGSTPISGAFAAINGVIGLEQNSVSGLTYHVLTATGITIL
ncbi:MAG: hypothetical protein ABFD49_02510 [Armatimonadota bacterium]|nr:hypothetical protein [bacterium]